MPDDTRTSPSTLDDLVEPAIHPVIGSELRALQQPLTEEGVIRPQQQLRAYHDAFLSRFGPDVLRGLEGQALLERMHAHGSTDSLVYWLEFKDDEEFPAIFGSIAGGSALKFGVYKRSETGTWAARGTRSAPRDISIDEAIEIASRHRDQLLAAAEFVGTFSGSADADYIALQAELRRISPDIEDTAWGHKYLSLVFPFKIDPFHVSDLQRYELVRLLQLPPRIGNEFATGRYVCAGRVIAVAKELDLPVEVAYQLLNRRHGQLRKYWRIGTSDGATRRNYWSTMRDNNVVAVGWPQIGDLSVFAQNEASRDTLRTLLHSHYPNTPQAIGRAAAQLLKFSTGVQEGDRVLASDGMSVLGVGEISGAYRFVQGTEFPHQRPVTWHSLEEWQAVDAEALQTAIGQIRDFRNQVATERHILDDAQSLQRRPVTRREHVTSRPDVHTASSIANAPAASLEPLVRLGGKPGLVQAILERKGQAILYGPPGTGKTYWALKTVRDLAALRAFGSVFDGLTTAQQSRVLDGSTLDGALVRTCSFHPEYGYEDFIEGFRPCNRVDGQLGFNLVPGVFRRLCSDAEKSPHLDFYLVIDEINRGDIPRIFGELLTLLERDKRGQALLLPVSGERFSVPANVFLVGTMNTADRSIALLDVALRRRFGFVELMPDYSMLRNVSIGGLPLAPWLKDLNQRIRAAGGGDARNRQVGHAFFLERGLPIATIDQLAAVMRDDIAPLLGEYCYDDFAQLTQLLGPGLVDTRDQQIDRGLFEPGRGADLIEALMRPEVATAAASLADPTEENVNDTMIDSEDADPETSPSHTTGPVIGDSAS